MEEIANYLALGGMLLIGICGCLYGLAEEEEE